MDPFKLGLRNLIGITAPGAIVLLALAYGLIGVVLVLEIKSSPLGSLKDAEWFATISALLLSYLLGNVFRLNSADELDSLSSCHLEERCQENNQRDNKLNPNFDLFKFIEERQKLLTNPKMLDSLDDPDEERRTQLLPDFDRWLWSTELFPYPALSILKLRRYRPTNMALHFDPYHEVTRRLVDIESRKEFFDYCKMAVVAHRLKQDEPLIEEVQAAEANVRFFAGTYFAMEFSATLMAVLQLWMMALVGIYSTQPMMGVYVFIPSFVFYCAYRLWRKSLDRRNIVNKQDIVPPASVTSPVPSTGVNQTTPPVEYRYHGYIVPRVYKPDNKYERKFMENLEKRHVIDTVHGGRWFFSYVLQGTAIASLVIFRFLDRSIDLGMVTRAASVLLTSMALIRLMHLGSRMIVERFRLRRIMEVDTVFEAFYLVNQKLL